MPEVVPSNGRLDDLARNIKTEWEKGRNAYADATDSYISMGHQLKKARSLIASDTEFGRWFKKQEFPFSTAWARTLREAAENEGETRAALASQLASGRAANIEKAVRAVVPPVPKPKAVEPAPVAPAGYTIKPPPPAPVQGPNDHTYDHERWKEGLHCLPGCPGPEPHKVLEDVGVRDGLDQPVEGPELTDPATGLSPNQIVGEGEGRGEEATPAPEEATVDADAVGQGAVLSPAEATSPSPDEVPPSPTGVAGVGSVGPIPRAVDAPEVRASEPSTEELPALIMNDGSDAPPDGWHVNIYGESPEDFRALSVFLTGLPGGLVWTFDGPASFTVDAQ